MYTYIHIYTYTHIYLHTHSHIHITHTFTHSMHISALVLLLMSPGAAGFARWGLPLCRSPPIASTSPQPGASYRATPRVLRCCAASSADASCSRRQILLQTAAAGGVGLGTQLLNVPVAAAESRDADDEDADVDETPVAASAGVNGLPKLASRFAKGQVKTLGPAGPLGPPDVAVPEWLEGKWSATYTLQQTAFPLTKDFAQFKQLLAGSIRSPSDALVHATPPPARVVSQFKPRSGRRRGRARGSCQFFTRST